MRTGVIAALLAVPAAASAEPDRGNGFEAAGFLGVDYYGDEIGLGGSPAPEQRPQTSPTFGGRLTYIAASIGSDLHLDLGLEAEASFTPAWTGYGFDGPRPSYFSPVFGYHGGLLFRLGGGWIQPHVTAGGGGETVISDSPYMAKETDPVFQWGGGLSFPMGDKWRLRFDGRMGLMEAIDGKTTMTFEAHMSIAARLGVSSRPPPIEVEIVTRPLPTPPAPRDSDKDGVVDGTDKCTYEPEVVNGIEDDDGCPERDGDGDGLIDASDKCPGHAEDMDSFEDEDGCPETDNDKDGVPDVRDQCPIEAETVNGITDEDGCVDEIPHEILVAFAEARKIKFDTGQRRLKTATKAILDRAIGVALTYPKLKLTVTIHPEKADPASTELAGKRLNLIKFYMTEQGVAMANLTTVVGAVVANSKQPLVEIAVTGPAN